MESSSSRIESDVTIGMRVTSGLQAQPLGVVAMVIGLEDKQKPVTKV